jgi:hypothetical protein
MGVVSHDHSARADPDGADWRVFATCRHPGEADALQQLARERDNVSA